VDSYVDTNVSEKYTASIFRDKEGHRQKNHLSEILGNHGGENVDGGVLSYDAVL
jgi:hypothetical protein